MNDRKAPTTGTRSVLLELFAAEVRAARLLRAALEGAPLTADEFAVYSLIGARGPFTPGRLASALGLRRPALSNHLARMEERGDLVRQTDPRDRRSATIALSASGRAKVRDTAPRFGSAAEPFRIALGPRYDAVLEALREVSAALDDALEQQARATRSPGRGRRGRGEG